MNNIQKINDIKYLIMEHYSDKEPLNESQQKSKECFNRYCDDIKKELKEKENIEQILEWLIIRIRIIPREWRDSIETELQLLLNKEHMSYLKMGKGLEAQDIIIDMFNKYANKPNDEGEFFKFCNADAVVKKELKALEIIKEKLCRFSFYDCEETYEDEWGGKHYYSITIEAKDDCVGYRKRITQEEYDLLKEVFEND